jgi:hypothetical protein
MKKTIAASLLVAVMMLSIGATAYAGKDYYKLYKLYEARYKKAKKEIKKLKAQRDDYGNQNESTYLDLVQCQRQLIGANPWLEADQEKGGSQ